MSNATRLTDEEKEQFVNITVHVDRTAINVLDHYRRKGFTRLPATPTMTGAELKGSVPGYNPSAELHLSRGAYLDDDPAIGDNETVALTDGMTFYSVPPATHFNA